MLKLQIAGFEPVSLNNFTGKVACTVFTSGCNLRCRYCHNRELVVSTASNIDLDELKKRIIACGLKNIVITGGEPMLQRGLEDFLIWLKNLKMVIKIDTNGTFPHKLEKLINSSLIDYVAIDIKGFSEEDFKFITRKDGFYKVFDSISITKKYKLPFELRYTMWKIPEMHNVKMFLRDAGLKSSDCIYLQKMIKSESNLDKRFYPQITENEVYRFREALSEYLSVYLRGF
jgi:pyruvate formate lyase activating enzyme